MTVLEIVRLGAAADVSAYQLRAISLRFNADEAARIRGLLWREAAVDDGGDRVVAARFTIAAE